MRFPRSLLAALLAIAPISACGDATSPAPGIVSLLLTDAPGDVRTAMVTISQIYLQGGDGDDPSSGGRVVLREEDVTVDLLTLADATLDLVDEVTVPGGRYAQLRFVITGAYIEVEQADGTTKIYASSPTYAGLPENAEVAGTLIMPSFATSGLKVNLPGDQLYIDGGERTLLVDFDVEQSFGKEAGDSGNWVMHPVIDAEPVATGSAAP